MITKLMVSNIYIKKDTFSKMLNQFFSRVMLRAQVKKVKKKLKINFILKV